MVTDAHKQKLDRDGYCVIRRLLDEAKTVPVRARMEKLWNGHHDYGWPHRHLQTSDPDDRDTPGGNYRSGSLASVQDRGGLRRLHEESQTGGRDGGAARGPVKRYTDQTIFKPAVFKAGRSFFYHQDSFYWKLRPKVCLNCWIALDEVAPAHPLENPVPRAVRFPIYGPWLDTILKLGGKLPLPATSTIAGPTSASMFTEFHQSLADNACTTGSSIVTPSGVVPLCGIHSTCPFSISNFQ